MDAISAEIGTQTGKNGKNGHKGTKEKKLHLIGNAHIDPVWLWQWQEGYHEVKATFYAVLNLMREYPDFVFTSSSAAYYEWIEQSDPEMFAEIQKRVAEGRWGLVGGWWIQPDCNIPGGESFVRQGLYGQRYFQEKFGRIARVGYNVDSFGHHGMLPQILKKSGMDAYVFMRPMPHEKGLPGRLFWWESDDCSRVLGFRIPFEYSTWGQDLEQHVRRCATELHAPVEDLMCFYGVGNHGGGPTRENLESLQRLRADPDLPKLIFSTPEAFFEQVRRENPALPVVHDDLQHHASGCYAAHSGVKRLNRQAENLLLSAEKLSSVALREKVQAYPEDLGRAWKNVLFNQFHDILAGTSVEAAYEDARNDYGEALAIAGRAQNAAVQALAWKIAIEPEAGMRPLVVFNPHPWRVKADVELELGGLKAPEVLLDADDQQVPMQEVQSAATAKGRNRISFVADLPSLGYSLYRIAARPNRLEVEAMHATDTELENDRFRLEFDDETGFIKRLWDKREGVEVFSGPAARPVVLDDPSDTWSHNTFRYDQVAGEFKARSVRLVEHGPVKSTIRVTSEWGASLLVQDFSLYRERDGIDVKVMVDWRAGFHALKLRFPLNLTHMRPLYEIPYGSIERSANGEEEPSQSWLDVSGFARETGIPYGLSLLNDGKYSLDVNIRDIGLTVLRSPIYAHHIPMTPDPEKMYPFTDQGVQRFRYTLLPHTGGVESAQPVRRALELNQPPVHLLATYHPGPLPARRSFLEVDQDNVTVTVLKKAEDSDDLVLRAYETEGTAVTAIFRLLAWDRFFEATFGPSEIKTFRIPADGSLQVIETNLLEWEDGR